jgi:Integrase core domain
VRRRTYTSPSQGDSGEATARRHTRTLLRHSMGSVGDCYDNALCESFFATVECEWLDRHRFQAQAEARMARLRFHRGFLQPAPTSFVSRIPLARQLRKKKSTTTRGQRMLREAALRPAPPPGPFKDGPSGRLSMETGQLQDAVWGVLR